MMTRRISAPLRIDFTPFVSIALLLIVFFVWQKETKRPVIMGVTVPPGCRKYESPHYPRKIVTLFLLDQNRIGFMQYWPGSTTAELQRTDFQPEGLNKLLETVNKSANDDVAVVIKPTSLATFGNVVSTLKILKRIGNLPYLLVSDLTGTEQRMLQHYEQMFVHYPSSSFNKASILKTPSYYNLRSDS